MANVLRSERKGVVRVDATPSVLLLLFCFVFCSPLSGLTRLTTCMFVSVSCSRNAGEAHPQPSWFHAGCG